jgi:predicted HD phosphohydrolase
MALTIEQITALFRVQGTVQYGSEAVSQLQHALQCAHLAERSGSAPALIAAALLP